MAKSSQQLTTHFIKEALKELKSISNKIHRFQTHLTNLIPTQNQKKSFSLNTFLKHLKNSNHKTRPFFSPFQQRNKLIQMQKSRKRKKSQKKQNTKVLQLDSTYEQSKKPSILKNKNMASSRCSHKSKKVCFQQDNNKKRIKQLQIKINKPQIKSLGQLIRNNKKLYQEVQSLLQIEQTQRVNDNKKDPQNYCQTVRSNKNQAKLDILQSLKFN